MRKKTSILTLIIISIFIQFAYVNCSGVSSSEGGFYSASYSADGGNGGGYDGKLSLNAPITARPGTQFVVAVLDGVGPFNFTVTGGAATVVKVDGREAVIQVSDGALDQSQIQIYVTDSLGASGESLVAVTKIDNQFSQLEKNYSFQRSIAIDADNVVIGWPSLAQSRKYVTEVNSIFNSSTQSTIESTKYECGYISFRKYNVDQKIWEIASEILGCDLWEVIKNKGPGGSGIFIYNFGGAFSVKDNVLSVKVTYGWLSPSGIPNYADLIAIYKKQESDQSWSFEQALFFNELSSNPNVRSFSKTHILSDSEIVVTQSGLIDGLKKPGQLYILKNSNGLWQKTQSISSPVVSMQPESLQIENNRLFLFIRENYNYGQHLQSLSAVVIYKLDSHSNWILENVVNQPQPGLASNAEYKDGVLFWNILVDDGLGKTYPGTKESYVYPNGYSVFMLSLKGLFTEYSHVVQKIISMTESPARVWAKTNEFSYESPNFCNRLSIKNTHQLALGCSGFAIHMQVAAVPHRFIAPHMGGRVLVFENKNGQWHRKTEITPSLLERSLSGEYFYNSYGINYGSEIWYAKDYLAIGTSENTLRVYHIK